MSNMISIASGFQYSVNIGYDLNNDNKIKNFIPTASAIKLLEDILLSTASTSTERARILIGAYGKGKSHIMLMILSLLMKKDLSLFESVLAKVSGSKLYQSILNYYESDNKILPVIVTGSNTSLNQALLLALQRTLSSNNLLDVMPETNYQAAIATIKRWKKEFPDTFYKFEKSISVPVNSFLQRLDNFDVNAYEEFEQVYPLLTAGSVFNPFLGFDVVELYENAAKGLQKKGYSGIFVVYDEFSKYLEANIKAASISDTKMLQDFAEKCNRSGTTQMHIMLISHKEISNYIDVLPKQKVDGWRGVSERFLHVRISNNFSQTYEIISTVIKKNNTVWDDFCNRYNKQFSNIEKRYSNHQMFSDMTEEDIKKTIFGCYPLHPVSTFILPRLSERVAQNERTLFTFLSANGVSTLPAWLEMYDDQAFSLLTPDVIYDYFNPLLKKEIYSGALHENYVLTETILDQLGSDSLESKIVKCISLIYILEQFEKLKPTKDEIFGIFSGAYSNKEIDTAINDLIDKEFVLYLKRSNYYLQLKQTSGTDIQQKISDEAELLRQETSVEKALNDVGFENYMYPSRYNDAHEMIRYFSFHFISENTLDDNQISTLVTEDEADGMIFAILPDSQESIPALKEKLNTITTQVNNAVFVLPKNFYDVNRAVLEYHAVIKLREQASGDRVLFDEYEVVYEDLRSFLLSFISSYTRPELYQSLYYYNGQEYTIKRKAAFSELLSTICDDIYPNTPIINNEALNRNQATSIARNSRHKVVAALLRNDLEPNLGLTGTGQDVSIMRSTLFRTGVLQNDDNHLVINLHPADNPLISNLFTEIETFICEARDNEPQSFSTLFSRLCTSERGIALRKELVPIYLAVALHENKEQVVIKDNFGQMILSADTLTQVNAHPEKYYLEYLDWNPEKADFVKRMETIFSDSVVAAEKSYSSYDYLISAIKRWYVSLPKYAKEMKVAPDGSQIDKGYNAFMCLLRQNYSGFEFLFDDIPRAFGYTGFVVGVVDNVFGAKRYYDEALNNLSKHVCKSVKLLFVPEAEKDHVNQMSLASVIKDWCETLDPMVFEQLFPDGTEKCLALFNSVSNDEKTFIARLAKATTDLRLDDWNDQTLDRCLENLIKYKKTAENFHALPTGEDNDQAMVNEDIYQLSFTSLNGVTETKRFEKIETSGRAKLLYNKIISELDSFGQAVTEAEKRQILMDVLKKLC